MSSRGKVKALVAIALALSGLGAGRVVALPLLSHDGRWLTDPKGRVVILHGLQVDRLKPTAPIEYIDLSPANVHFLAGEGFNAARVSISYSGVEPSQGTYDERYIGKLLAFDRRLADSHVYDLVDMMQGVYSSAVGGWGFPDWMTVTGDALNNHEPFPRGYLDNPAENAAWDNFWGNAEVNGEGLQDIYARGLTHLARELRDSPGLLGIELMNEPWAGSPWPTCASPLGCVPGGFDQTALTSFSRRMIDAIRSSDRKHLVFYEPNLLFDFGADTRLGGVQDPNAVFAFHDYCLGAAPGFPSPPDPVGACGIDERIVLANAQARSRRTGDALLLDEWGNNTDAALTHRIAGEADDAMVGWTDWAYEDCCNSPAAIVRDGRRPPTGANLNRSQLDLLVRPYPQAVAGTPTSWRFDPQGRAFHLSYSTAAVGPHLAAGARTRVEVPPLVYERGYSARVSGGRIVSAPDADPLVISSRPGATNVSLDVVPATHHPETARIPRRCFTSRRPLGLGLGSAIPRRAALWIDGRRFSETRPRRLFLPGGLTPGTRIRTVATTADGRTIITRRRLAGCRLSAARASAEP